MNSLHSNLWGFCSALIAVSHVVQSADGTILWYTDLALWRATAGATTTVDFVSDLPPTLIQADEYVSQGLILDYQAPYSPSSSWWRFDETSGAIGALSHDGGGLGSANEFRLAFQFSEPLNAFGMVGLNQSTDAAWFFFYLNGMYVGHMWAPAGEPVSEDPFDGVITDFYFDRVAVSGWDVDDVCFSTVPTPAGFPLLALSGIIALRGRRR